MFKKQKKGIFYYLNPYNWIRNLVSFVLSILLFINHFFVRILVCVILFVIIYFAYDRYASFTYKDVEDHERYESPLTQGEKSLGADLDALYANGKLYKQSEQKIEENTDVVLEKDVPENTKLGEHGTSGPDLDTSSDGQKEVDVLDAMVSDYYEEDIPVRDMQPIWDREDEVPKTFIYQEVQKRMDEIRQKTMKKQKRTSKKKQKKKQKSKTK